MELSTLSSRNWGGGEIYLIKGPKDIGLLTISEQNIINSNS